MFCRLINVRMCSFAPFPFFFLISCAILVYLLCLAIDITPAFDFFHFAVYDRLFKKKIKFLSAFFFRVFPSFPYFLYENARESSVYIFSIHGVIFFFVLCVVAAASTRKPVVRPLLTLISLLQKMGIDRTNQTVAEQLQKAAVCFISISVANCHLLLVVLPVCVFLFCTGYSSNASL